MVSDFGLERQQDIYDIEAFLNDMTLSHSLSEIAQNLPHIKELKEVLNHLCDIGYVENTSKGFRLTFKGSKDYINNTYLE